MIWLMTSTTGACTSFPLCGLKQKSVDISFIFVEHMNSITQHAITLHLAQNEQPNWMDQWEPRGTIQGGISAPPCGSKSRRWLFYFCASKTNKTHVWAWGLFWRSKDSIIHCKTKKDAQESSHSATDQTKEVHRRFLLVDEWCTPPPPQKKRIVQTLKSCVDIWQVVIASRVKHANSLQLIEIREEPDHYIAIYEWHQGTKGVHIIPLPSKSFHLISSYCLSVHSPSLQHKQASL